METLIIILALSPPILSIIYAVLEYLRFIDWLTGRMYAIKGLERLQRTTGFPKSWIYNDENDRRIFKNLEKRMSRKTKQEKIKNVLSKSFKPSLITTAGNPTPIYGIPDEWPQDEKFFYPDNQPILYIFHPEKGKTMKRGEPFKGKGDKVCTLGELSKWLEKEKVNRLFIIGILVISLFSLTILILKIYIQINT